MHTDHDIDDQDIAIVGMAGRLPGAATLDAFWQNLIGGVESIRPVTDAELDALGVPASLRRDPSFVKATSMMEGYDRFDAAFFGYTPREAELMDPQHRVFLECCWQALEHAGYAPQSTKGAVGVFAGTSTNTYLIFNLVSNLAQLDSLDQVQIDVGNGADFLSTRVAYKLNLRGPSYTVLCGCSTSLVATHVAVQSLLNEECDLALAGGVSIQVKHPEGYLFVPGGVSSPDGHCRAFDAKAEGTVFGSGVGVVALKRLKDAVRDRDFIHAVIKGSAINNDGSAKVGYTAPSVEGQAAVISEALAASGVAPETIGYVETHGTGTNLGDPIEIRALAKAFRARADAPPAKRIPIGSLKSNIGHLSGAAGVASLIKAVLTLENGKIPPSLFFERPNPEIDFAHSPFEVNTTPREWPANSNIPRRAGVSSFGIGGTNAHVVLQEAPAPAPSGPSRPAQLLVLSAKTPAALETATENLARHLEAHPGQALADVAYTLQVGRQPMSHRRALVCQDREDALRALQARDASRLWTVTPAALDRPVAFLFPGHGSQYVGMAQELYATEPAFREQVDLCARHLQPLLGLDIREVLYPAPDRADDAVRKLESTVVTHPVMFTVEYALAQLWISWGVRPKAMIGHSLGEYVAACVAGVFSLPDALAVVTSRAQLLSTLPPGAMLAVIQSEEELKPLLTPELSVAAVNAPGLTVVSGAPAPIQALKEKLDARGLDSQLILVPVAGHSPVMEPLMPKLAERIRQVKLSPPQIPYVSNVTGTWIEAAQATDPAYYATHLRQTVRFSEGLKTLQEKQGVVMLEVGPGHALSRLAKQQVGPGAVVLNSVRHPKDQVSDAAVLQGTLGRLWLNGVEIHWPGYAAREQRRRLPLPTYPFERQRYWIEAWPLGTVARPDAPLEKKSDISDWFYVPSWKRAPLARVARAADAGRWLIFSDGAGVAEALASRLTEAGEPAIQVLPGAAFGRRADGAFILDPRRREDYAALLDALKAEGHAFDHVAHLWTLSPEPLSLERALDAGFYSLLFLAQALAAQGRTEPLQWFVASNGLAQVERADRLAPEKAPLLGPCQVVPQEYPHISCRAVDVALDTDRAALAEHLLREMRAGASEPLVAYRGRQRWVQTFEPLRLEEDATPARALREGGAYLVTDGLSGVGWALASALARRRGARLAIVEEPDFPSREQWPQWLSSHGADDPVSRRIQNARALEAAGTELLMLDADLADEARMRQVVARTTERFGRIDGVFHTAGGLRTDAVRTIAETTPADCARHFAPLVHGVRVLEKVLSSSGPDFCLLAGSLSSIVGGFGQVAYAAASHFVDAFAEQRAESTPSPWISADWDAWQFADAPSVAALSPALAQLAIKPEEGAAAAERLLAQVSGGRVAISTGELALRRRLAARTPSQPGAEASAAGGASHARPSLTTEFVAPRTDLERAVAAMWGQVLGIEQIGVDDNFFELGGHSLMATQLRNRLYTEFKVDLPLRGLFDTPTVAGIAARIAQHLQQSVAESGKAIAERLCAAFPTEKQGILEDYLKRRIAKSLNRPVEQLPTDGSLAGFDLRLLGSELEYDLKQDFKFQFYLHEIQEHPSIPELARYLVAEMDRLADLPSLVSELPLSAFPLKPYRKRAATRAASTGRKNRGMVFVHSSPRAGSTLFRVMLAGHPRLFCPPEINLLFFRTMREYRENIGFGHEMDWTMGGLQWAFTDLMGTDSQAGQKLIDKLVAEDVPTQDVFARLQELCAPRLLLDKTPSYSLDPETLWHSEELFDQPKYLYLFRHPYPVMQSLVRLRFDRLFAPSLFGDTSVDPHVVAETVWALCNRNLLEFFDKVDRKRVHWVRYEDLVRDPRPVMTAVCEFLEIPFDERVLQPYDGKRERMMGGLGDPNILSHDRIDPGLGEAWKQIKWPRPLDPGTRALMTRLGYDAPQAAPPRPEPVKVPSTPVDAEQLLANLDQLSNEQVAALLAELEGRKN